jgi:hypothetical protein
MNILIQADPAKMSDIDSPKEAHDTLGPKKTKKNEEAQDISNISTKSTSILIDQGGDGREIYGAKVK